MLYELIIDKCELILQEKRNRGLNRGKGAARFGFRGYEDSDFSIRNVILSREEAVDHIRSYCNFNTRIAKKRPEIEIIKQSFNGKYLYNRIREAENDVNRIPFSGVYEKIYFIFLDCKDIHAFLKKYEQIDEAELEKQNKLLSISGDDISAFSIPFLAYYYSYREYTIKKFLLEIDYLNDFKVKQTGFHYTFSEDAGEYQVFNEIAKDKIYWGKSVQLENSLQIFLEGKKNNGRTNYMNILLYKGGMNIPEMKLIRGVFTTMSSHGYIISGEIFLRRIEKDKITTPSSMLSSDFDIDNKEIQSIKRYLFIQNRTIRIPAITEQNMRNITAKRAPLNILENMIGTWKIWGLDYKNRIIQSKFVIEKDYSSYLSTTGEKEQVCFLRFSRSTKGYSLWISAHQEVGIEMQNVAIVTIPLYNTNPLLTDGVSCGLGIRRVRYAVTPIVFIKPNDPGFLIKRLDEKELTTALRSLSDSEVHQEAYKKLQEKTETWKPIRSLDHINWDVSSSNKNMNFE